MGTRRALTSPSKHTAAQPAAACMFAGAFVLMSALAAAQDGSPAPKAREEFDFFASVGRWFENFGHEAGIAARTSADNAKDAADAVVRIPKSRVIVGHAKCETAPNGAPDCVAAAAAMCKAKGFGSGKSVDMTTAEVCPAQVYRSGRSGGAGCRTETFLSRVLCQ
jgi:hypothetical protein